MLLFCMHERDTFLGCYLLMGSRNRDLGHVTGVQAWRLYPRPRQHRCLAPGDYHYRILGFRPSHLRALG